MAKKPAPKKGEHLMVRCKVTLVREDDCGQVYVTIRIPGSDTPVTVNLDHLDLVGAT